MLLKRSLSVGLIVLLLSFFLGACFPAPYQDQKSPIQLNEKTGVLSNFTEVDVEANLTPTSQNKVKLDFINFNSFLSVPACGWYGLIEISAFSNGQLVWSKEGRQKQVFQQVLFGYEMKFSVQPDAIIEMESGNSYIDITIMTVTKETKVYDGAVECMTLPEIPELVDWSRIENPAGVVSFGNTIDFSVLFTKPEDYQSDTYSHTTIRLNIPVGTANKGNNNNLPKTCPFPTVDALTENPENSAFVGDRVKFQGVIPSVQCFRAVRIMIDGQTLYEGKSPTFSFEWDTQKYEAGNHQIVIETAVNDDPDWKNPGRISHTYQLLPSDQSRSSASGAMIPPSVRSPGESARLKMGTDVILEWSPITGAKEYLVILWGGPYKEMTPCNWMSGTSCRIGQMWSGTFSWKVMARNSEKQETSWGGPWTFTVLSDNSTVNGNPPVTSSTQPNTVPSAKIDCNISSYSLNTHQVTAGQTVTISGKSTCDFLKLSVDTYDVGNVVNGPNASFTWNTSGKAAGGHSVCIRGQKAGGTWTFWCDSIDIRSNVPPPTATPSVSKDCAITSYSKSASAVTAGQTVTISGKSTCDFLKLSVDTYDVGNVVNGPNASFTWNTSGKAAGGHSVCIRGQKAGGTWTFWCDSIDIRSNAPPPTATPSVSKDCAITSYSKSASAVTAGQTVTISGKSTCDFLKLSVDTYDVGNVVNGPNASFTWNTSGKAAGGHSVCIRGQKAGGTWTFWCDSIDIRSNAPPPTATPSVSKDCAITSYSKSASAVTAGQTVTISGKSTCDFLKLSVDTYDVGNVVNGPNASFTWNTSGKAAGGHSVCIRGQKAGGTWTFWCDSIDIRSNAPPPTATPSVSKDCAITSYSKSASAVTAGQTVTISGKSTCDFLKLSVDTYDVGNVVNGPNASFTWNTSGKAAGGHSVCIRGQKAGGTWTFWCDSIDIRN